MSTAPGDPSPSPAERKPGPRASYLALPARDLAFLKNTLRLYLREEKVAEVVQAFGARCGAGQVVQSQVEVHEAKELAEVVPAMCAQIGLAKIRPLAQGPDRLRFELTRVAEALPYASRETRMEFTRGFLEGALGQLLNRRVRGTLELGEAAPDSAVVELRWTSLPGPAPSVSDELATESPAPGPTSPAPERGSSRVERRGPPSGAFLVEESPGLLALPVFTEAARQRGGLAITVAARSRELRARKDLTHLQVYDLTSGEGTGLLSLDAGNLPALLSSVDEFVKRTPSGVVMITDLPMLLSANGVEPTRNFLSIVAEMLGEGKGTLYAVAPSGGLSAGDRSLLLRTLKPYVRAPSR